MGQGGEEPCVFPHKLWVPPMCLSSNACLSFPSMGLFGSEPWILSSGISEWSDQRSKRGKRKGVVPGDEKGLQPES